MHILGGCRAVRLMARPSRCLSIPSQDLREALTYRMFQSFFIDDMCDEMPSPSVIILEAGWAYQLRWWWGAGRGYITRACQRQHETIPDRDQLIVRQHYYPVCEFI